MSAKSGKAVSADPAARVSKYTPHGAYYSVSGEGFTRV